MYGETLFCTKTFFATPAFIDFLYNWMTISPPRHGNKDALAAIASTVPATRANLGECPKFWKMPIPAATVFVVRKRAAGKERHRHHFGFWDGRFLSAQ